MKVYKLGLRPPSADPGARRLADYLEWNQRTAPAVRAIDMSSYAAQQPHVMTAMMANGPDPAAPAKIKDFGVGDCFWAAAVRFAALTAASKGRVLWHNAEQMCAAALDGYASTGWDINQTDAQGNNPTDQGTDPTQGFKWLQTVGLLAADGTRHKFGPMLQVNPKDFNEVEIAFEVAEGLMIGVNFPADWENGPVWDATSSQIEGGHEIPAFSNLNLGTQGIEIDTWGNASPGPRIITPAGLAQQCNQLTAVMNPAEFGKHGRRISGKRRHGRNVEGFNARQWLADLKAEG